MPNQYASIDDEFKAKIARARSLGYWLLNHKTGRWMSPIEFEDEYTMHKITSSITLVGWLRDYVPADPKKGIQARIKRVADALTELEKFSNLVFDNNYFKEKDRVTKIQ